MYKRQELYLTGVEASGERVVVDGGQPFDRQMEQHTVLLDSASDPVSYTHLDVYKRQVYQRS